MRTFFYQVLLVAGLGLTSATVFAQNELSDQHLQLSAIELPMAEDLKSVSTAAQTQKLPILLIYSAEDCEYCQQLEADLLNPMMMNGDFKQRIIIRKVMIDGAVTIKDFSGKSVEPGEFAYRQGVEVTPTLQFVDAKGNQLVSKIIGYQSAELYGAYLDNAIGGSLELVRKVSNVN